VANYGDVALNLSADWSRRKVHDKRHALLIVGHEDGKSDVFLTNEPDEQHHFTWVDPRNQDEIDLHRTNGFAWVQNSEWSKNPHLWEWDGDGYVRCFGQRLMARPAALYFEAEAEKERERELRENRADKEAEKFARKGKFAIDYDDEPRRVARR
jgi:hypothetical protein